jgi:hypothetical protein
MIILCPQLKQNLANINSLKSGLDLELSKLEEVFKELKNGDPSTSLRAERKELINKIKEVKIKIDSEINKIEGDLPVKEIESGKKFNLKVKYRKIVDMIDAAGLAKLGQGSYISSIAFLNPQEEKLLGKEIELKAKIFDFKKDISSKDALKELDKKGYRPATLIELLALAEVYPDLQKKFSIVSLHLGSSVDRQVPYLGVDSLVESIRQVNLHWFDNGDWKTRCRFLAILKESN